jgi:hypothetical protein
LLPHALRLLRSPVPGPQKDLPAGDSIERVDLPQSPLAERLVKDMEAALGSENRGEAERFTQALLNDLARG